MILSKKRVGLCFSLLALTVGGSQAAVAEEPVSLGAFVDWTAYSYKLPDTKVCYVVSQPKSSDSSKKIKRDPVFFLITNMPGRKISGEISTVIGFPFKEKSLAEVKVDNEAFDLFTNGDGAWADTTAKEKKIVGLMKTGKKLSVKATSWKGTETTDHYSLTGLASALDKINSACK